MFREFTKPERQRQPERHLIFCKGSIVSVRYLQYIIQKDKMRPPITQGCLKTIYFSVKTNIQNYFGRLDLHHRTPEIGFPSCENEKDNFKDSQRKQIRTENNESFESKVLKQKQHCVAVAVAVVVS